MSALAAFFEKLDDGFNPIVVKELRQAVRSRFIVAALLLFLAIQLTTIAVYLMLEDNIASDFQGGRRIFVALQTILVSGCLFLVPAYTAIRLGFERSGNNVDLLFITTIRPRSIIWGKFLAGIILAVLLYSTSMPFMTFVFLLRGIDLPSIFLALAFSFLVVLTGIQVAIFIASLPASIALKILLGLLAFAQITGFLWSTLRFSFVVAIGGIRPAYGPRGFLGFASSTLIVYLTVIGLLYVLSVAMISPTTANRTFPIRVYAVILWVVFGVISMVLGGGPRRGYDAILAWGHAMVLLFSAGLWLAVSERETLSLRVARTIPRTPFLRQLAFLFYTGAAGGAAWSIVMIGLTLLVCLSLFSAAPSGYANIQEQIEVMGGRALYAYCYAISAVLVRRRFFPDKIRPSQTWAVALGLLAVGSLFPMLVAYLASPERFMDTIDKLGLWTAANPFLLGDADARASHLGFAIVWASVVTILAAPWFATQARAFFRYQKPRIEPRGATVNSE